MKPVQIVAVFYLIAIIWLTGQAMGQPLSTVDTVQNLEISRAQDMSALNSRQIEELAKSHDQRINQLRDAVADLAGAINRGTGIVIGIGSTLTVLQIIQMFMARRKEAR